MMNAAALAILACSCTAAPACAQTDDFLCVPGVSCGPIDAGTTLDDLLYLFGEENVTSSRAWVAEGTLEVWASHVIASDGSRFSIYWQEGDSPEAIGFVDITDPASGWHTAEGVRVGTTLSELNEINGVPFEFLGFDWDYGGFVSDWRGGRLEGLSLRLGYDAEDASAYMGDLPIESDDPGLDSLGVVVRGMTFRFDDPFPKDYRE